MKSLLTFLCSLVLVFVCFSEPPAKAQSGSDAKNRTGNQWVSHQMNQPPPDVIEKNKLSKDRLEEIRRLYLQAKQEQEEENKTGAKTPK